MSIYFVLWSIEIKPGLFVWQILSYPQEFSGLTNRYTTKNGESPPPRTHQ